MNTPTGVRALTIAAWLIVALGIPASAQVVERGDRSPAVQEPATNVPGWELGGHGGLSLLRVPAGGKKSLPNPGPAITTSSPIFPSRQTSSWFFGDGAALLNDASADFDLLSRITPLDEAFESVGFGNAARANFGVRVARGLTPRLSVEFDFDVMPGSLSLTDAFTAAIESTRTSFQSAFTSLFASGPFVGVVVETTGATNDGASREIAGTGAITLRFTSRGSYVPYATIGAGVITRTGELQSVTLEGRYRFTISVPGSPSVPIDETDRVTIRYSQCPAFVTVVGGGLRRDMSERWGFRIDGRLFLGRPTLRLLLDASPSSVPGTPAGFIETFSYPSIQFSSNPSSGRQSTLGGPPLEGFAALTSTGIETRGLLTIGVFRRF